MSVVYSPLCETDRAAYLAYCIASYGASVGQSVPVTGSGDGARPDGSGIDSGLDVAVGAGRRHGAWTPWLAFLGGGPVVVDSLGVGGCGAGAWNGEVGDGGSLAGSGVGGSRCSDAGVSSGAGQPAACGFSDTDGVEDASVGKVRGVVGPNGGVSLGRGPNYERNQENRRRRKLAAARRRSGAAPSVAPSLSPTVETVTTEMAEELEARRTLALRRSAENKAAAALAEHRLRSLADKDKTAALARLDAARVEQRINDAKAKSQASYKKCDESLGSLGSTGSAGEFALKKEVQAAKDEVLAVKRQRDYYEKQLSVSFSYISPEGMRAVAELPEPVYDDDRVDDCGLDELPEDMPVNDKVAYLTRMGCQDAAEALLFETYGF